MTFTGTLEQQEQAAYDAATTAIYRELGARIRDRRKRLGMTQKALGERLHPPRSPAMVSFIESGKRLIDLGGILELSVLLGYDLLGHLDHPADAPWLRAASPTEETA